MQPSALKSLTTASSFSHHTAVNVYPWPTVLNTAKDNDTVLKGDKSDAAAC